MELWLSAGKNGVDGATNYPINQNIRDFKAAESILAEFVRTHGLTRRGDLDITMKIGSLTNLRSPDNDLSKDNIRREAERYHQLFEGALGCLMLHWDNRSEHSEIQASIDGLLSETTAMGIRPGLSGIAHPQVYAEVLPGDISFDIQLKYNVFQSDFPRYTSLQAAGKHCFYAYGLNAGGIKLEEKYAADSTFLLRGGDPAKVAATIDKIRAKLPELNLAFVRPPLKTMNQLGLVFAGTDARLAGLVLGVSTPEQLAETLDFWRNVETFDYEDVRRALSSL